MKIVYVFLLACASVRVSGLPSQLVSFVVLTALCLNATNMTKETSGKFIKNNPVQEQKAQHATVVYEIGSACPKDINMNYNSLKFTYYSLRWPSGVN